MSDHESQLTAIAEVPGLVDQWREQEASLLEKHQAELNRLREARKIQETTLSAGVLQKVCDMCEGGLNARFMALDDLFNGFSVTDENYSETWKRPRANPLVPIQPYFQIAGSLGGNRAGEFLKSLMVDFQHQKSSDIPKDKIRLIGVGSSRDSQRTSGIVLLCDNNSGMGKNTHFGVGFDVYNAGEDKLPSVVVRSAHFLEEDHGHPPRVGSLNERFGNMLLSEQVSVIAALFVATDRAVTAALPRSIPAK